MAKREHVPAESVDTGDKAVDADQRWFKVRRCKFAVMQNKCPYGEWCQRAHTPEELRPSDSSESPTAPHWEGARVCIGVVDHALFWDLPPPGTMDVVCNRATCLGNPFAAKILKPGEVGEAPDEHGWHHQLHVELCEAFQEYLEALLSPQPMDEDLFAFTLELAKRRSLSLSELWVVQKLKRKDVLEAFRTLEDLLRQGHRLRLMCHCAPKVRCHIEYLKQHFEARLKTLDAEQVPVEPAVAGSNERSSDEASTQGVDCQGRQWPGFGLSNRICGRQWPGCDACWKFGRAMDPGSGKVHCADCWSRHYIDLKNSVKVAIDEQHAAAGGPALRPRCNYYAWGACQFGDQCRNAHVDDSASGPSVKPRCKYYAWGACQFGEQCRNSHALDDDRNKQADAGASVEISKTAPVEPAASKKAPREPDASTAHGATMPCALL